MRRIVGQVVNGHFVDGKPTEAKTRNHSLHKEFVRLDMQEKYRKDIVQPWKNGQPNPEYMEAYGKREAVNYFNLTPPEVE